MTPKGVTMVVLYQAIADECGVEAEYHQTLYQASMRKAADLDSRINGNNLSTEEANALDEEFMRTSRTTETLRYTYRCLVEAAALFTRLAKGEGRT